MSMETPLTKEQADKILAESKERLERIVHGRLEHDAEGARKAAAELAHIAAADTEEERAARLHAAIHRKHKYRAKSQTGKVHEFEHAPNITHLVVVNQDKPGEHHDYCRSVESARRVKELHAMTREEHLAIAKQHREHAAEHNDNSVLPLAEYREKMAAEAPGKTAEIMEVHVVEQK